MASRNVPRSSRCRSSKRTSSSRKTKLRKLTGLCHVPFRIAFRPALFQVTRGDERRGGKPHGAWAKRANAIIIESPQAQKHYAEWMTGLFALPAAQFA